MAKVKFKLVSSGLEKLAGKYTATVLPNAVNGLDQIASEISLRRPAIDTAEVNLVVGALQTEIKRLIGLGYSISMPLGTFEPQITGSVPYADSALTSENVIQPGFTINATTNAALKEIKPVNDVTKLDAQMFSVEDVATHEIGVIKGTAPFLVTGDKLSLTQTDESAAIIAADDSVLSNVTYVAQGSQPPIILKCQVASAIADGTYRLRIRTRGYNNPTGQLITLIKKVDVKAS